MNDGNGKNKNIFYCKCCGRELKGFRCDFCYLELPVDVGGTDIEKIIREHMTTPLYRNSPAYLSSPEYKKALLKELCDFSIIFLKYGWDKGQGFRQLGEPERHVIAKSAEELMENVIIWSDQDFSQPISDVAKEYELGLEYTLKGEKKQLKCNVSPVECDDFWHVGIKLNEQLKLLVYLGREDNYAVSNPIDLVLE